MISNVIIALVLFAVFAIALKGSVRHFRGEGACCGGGSEKVKKKKLAGKVIKTLTIPVTGMRCGNCADTVTKAINRIEGASAKVNLGKKTAIVSCDREIDEEVIRDAIRRAGYGTPG